MRLPTNARAAFDTWNGRLHYYLGLYFLLFIALFSLSGLLLNHHWEISSFWPQRSESAEVARFRAPVGDSAAAQAYDLMRQFGLSGELRVGSASAGRLEFQVVRPGAIAGVQADLASGEAAIKRIRVNGWGVVHMLHTFSGVRRNDPSQRREWLVTRLWSFSMDALAAGMIVMVLSSWIMWYRLKSKRRSGWIALAAGFLACGFFVFGLARIYG